MTTDVLALREALLRDIHTTFCERSAVAMRKYTPQVTAHQVEALVSDRLDALIAAVRAETLAGPGVVELEAHNAELCRRLDMHHDRVALPCRLCAAQPATPPTPADVRPCLDCSAPVLMTDVGANHLGDRLDDTHTPHVALWNQLHPATPPTPAPVGWADNDAYARASADLHLPTPVLTAARCGYLIRMLGLTPFICNRAEDDALHRSRTHPDAHAFLATPDPERLPAAIEAQAIGEVEA